MDWHRKQQHGAGRRIVIGPRCAHQLGERVIALLLLSIVRRRWTSQPRARAWDGLTIGLGDIPVERGLRLSVMYIEQEALVIFEKLR